MSLLSAVRQGKNKPARAINFPSPIGGWNTQDSLDQMDVKDAVELENWFPTVGRVISRKGFEEYATGLGTGNVETLAEYNAVTTRKLIAAANNNIYDVSSAGAAVSLASGFTNNRWQWAMFTGAAPRMALVNGADAPQEYNGSTVSALTISGSGLTVSNLIGVNIFKNRSYFWEKDSQDFWYSALNSLGGALTKFPLGRVAGFGGNLVAMNNWTRDSGDGVDDYAVFIMSTGDIIIYQGTDPSTAADWALVGVFRTGAPLGIRGSVKLGPDLIVMTKDGYVPLSKIIDTGRVTERGSVSDKINGAVKQVADQYFSNFGWQSVLYPRGSYVLFNVPRSSTEFDQHVVNTLTGAWTKFTGMNGACFGLYNDNLYMGGVDGTVYKCDTGTSDDGQSINLLAQTAWNYCGNRGNIKKFSAFRPVFQSESPLNFNISLGFDFQPNYDANITQAGDIGSESAWDEAEWDVDSWAENNQFISPWSSADGIGLNVSARVNMLTSSQYVSWYSMEYLFETGGYI